MPRLPEGLRRIAQQGERAAGIWRPDEGATRIVTYRNARAFVLLKPVDNERVREALRFLRPVKLRCSTNENGNIAPLHFIKHPVGHQRTHVAFPSPGRKARLFGLRHVVLRIHIGIVKIDEFRPRFAWLAGRFPAWSETGAPRARNLAADRQ